MEKHLLTHSDERKYKCHYKACRKRYKTLPQLKEHKFIHSGVTKHRCDWNECEKRLTKSYSIYKIQV